MRPLCCILIGWMLAGALAAQQPSLTGPVEAYTFDAPTRTLRAVIGVPGAASFGPALRDNLDFGSGAPHQNYALVFQQGRCLLISGLGSSTISASAMPGIKSQPDDVVWAGNGSLAVLYSKSGGWVQAVSGLPGTPAVAPAFDISVLGGALASVAVDGQGKHIALGISGAAGGVFLSTDGQTFANGGSIQNPIALAFSADSNTLYALDGNAAQVIAFGVSASSYQAIPLTGLKNPIGLQAGSDTQNRQMLYIAAGTDQVLRVLDPASAQVVNDIPLSVTPTGLQIFGSNSYVVAPRSKASNPLWLFAGSPQTEPYFVPAVRLNPVKHHVPANRGGAR